MGTLFDEMQARDEAIARAAEGAPAVWMERAKGVALHVAASKFDFTTDDVWAYLGEDKVREPRAMGAVMKALASEGRIRPTGEYRKSARPGCHARPVAVWRVAL